VPVAIGVIATLVHLLGAAHPDVGWSAGVNSDASALVTGQGVFNDPNLGYSGMFFTPLFPVVLAGLSQILWWEGWGTVLAIVAGVALAVMAAAIGRPTRAAQPLRAGRTAEAAGIGALAWSFVATLGGSDLYYGSPDQPAWALAVGGLLLVPPALGGSRRASAAAVLLLTAGLWTKQTTAGLILAVIVVAATVAWLRPLCRRPAGFLVLALLAANAAGFALFAALTHGWGPRWTIGLVQHFPVFQSLGFISLEFARDVALVAAFVAIALVLQLRGARKLSTPTLTTGLLAAAAVATSITGMWGRRYEGSSDHNYIGTVWVLAMLGASAYRSLRLTRPAAAWVLVAAFSLTALVPGHHWFALRRGAVVPASHFSSTPGRFIAYAERRHVYTPARGDFGARFGAPVYPNTQHLLNILEGGYRPGFFLAALLDRRFDVVYEFDERQAPFADPRGAFEDNFLWKLNQVIAAKYLRSTATPLYSSGASGGADLQPQYGFVPRAGHDPAGWMNGCFGPFRLGVDTTLDIRRGGGFWCLGRCGSAHCLTLRETPAPASEVISRNVVSAAGGLMLTLPHSSGLWQLRGGPIGPATIAATPIAGGLLLALRGSRSSSVVVPASELRRTHGAVTLRFTRRGAPGLQLVAGSQATVEVPTNGAAAARLLFAASRASGAGIAFCGQPMDSCAL
jgi:hypothetical protein